VLTVGDLRAWLRARGGVWAEALAEGRALRMAVDHAVARAETPLADGCEVAFFPPVTGG
jgi:molybdopterin synthase sulfur carrier subunit